MAFDTTKDIIEDYGHCEQAGTKAILAVEAKFAKETKAFCIGKIWSSTQY
jgi:hypothetical protein